MTAMAYRHALGAPELAAMAIGGVVGVIEILGRYRHAPLRAVLTWNGATYVMINMAASWAAYYMLDAFEVFKDVTKAKELTQVLTAGFGSLVFMRSSLFKVRVGESDIGIGPAAVLDTLLLVADRGVDRREAVARAQDVTALVSHTSALDAVSVAKMLAKYSLALMQNVDEKTSQAVIDATAKIMADPDTPEAIKMDIVALRLGVIVGPDVLEAAVAALGDRLSKTSGGIQPPAPPNATAPPPAASLGEPVATPPPSTLKAELDRKAREVQPPPS